MMDSINVFQTMSANAISRGSRQSHAVRGATIQSTRCGYATPPRRRSLAVSARAEPTNLTTGVFSTQKESWDRSSGGKKLGCTLACISPRQRRCSNSFISKNIASGDSPCASPLVLLSRTVSNFGSMAKPNQCTSLPSKGGPLFRGADGTPSSRSCSGLQGFSPSASVTLSEAEEEIALKSTESLRFSVAVEAPAPLCSDISTPKNARSPISPSFACFPSIGSGSAYESSVCTAEKVHTTRGAPSASFNSFSTVRNGCTATVNHNHNSNDHRSFEPLRLNASGRLPPSQQTFMGLQSSQRASCAGDLEPRPFDHGLLRLDGKESSLESFIPNAKQTTTNRIIKQQQVLYACLVSIARERSSEPSSYRGENFCSLRGHRVCFGRRQNFLTIIRWICTLLGRLMVSITARVVTAPAARVWQFMQHSH